jgi:hypothetical protein
MPTNNITDGLPRAGGSVIFPGTTLPITKLDADDAAFID